MPTLQQLMYWEQVSILFNEENDANDHPDYHPVQMRADSRRERMVEHNTPPEDLERLRAELLETEIEIEDFRMSRAHRPIRSSSAAPFVSICRFYANRNNVTT